MTHVQPLPTGTELVEDYRIERVLGAGGFGITYLAEEAALARSVTIKEYFPSDFALRTEGQDAKPRSESSSGDYQWGLDRFIDEAQTLAKFDHRNIVRVFRYFRANNTGYMVLQFEEGQSLKSWLRSLGRAARQKELDQVVAPLLDALSLIHSADFLHRDIAPDNIIIRTDGSPVLIDFGSAREQIAQHTHTVSALVKPGYSPYEQYAENGKQQGPWTDIYALASTLYHAVTGKRPPDAPSRIVKDELKPAREMAMGAYRAGFLHAIDRGLMLDIKKRPQSIAEWRGALLAPDPEQRGWFVRPSGSAGSGAGGVGSGSKDVHSGFELGSENDAIAATRRLTRKPMPDNAIPPQPDTPGRHGRFIDFVDGLRKPSGSKPNSQKQGELKPQAPQQPDPERALGPRQKRERAGQKPGDVLARGGKPGDGMEEVLAEAVPTAEKLVPQSPQTTPVQGRGLGWGPGPKRMSVQDAADNANAGSKIATPASGNRDGGSRALLLPVENMPLRPLVRRKPPKPRAIRGGGKAWWRPLTFKLLIGLGIASAAVAFQDRIPRFGLRGVGLVASSSQEVPEASISRNSRGRAQKDLRQNKTSTIRDIQPAPAASLLIRKFKAHPVGDMMAQFGDQGRWIITTGADATLKVWSVKRGKLIRTIEMDDGPATAFAVSGLRALSGHSEGTIVLWDLAAGRKLGSFKRNDARIWSVAFAGSKERFFAGAHDWTTTLWEISTPSAPLHVFKGHDNAVQAIAYAPSNGLLASGGADKIVRLWAASSLSKVQAYRREKDFVTALRFSPDGRWLAAGMLNGRIRILSTRSRRRGTLLRGHDGAISSLRFLGDGRRLVSSSKDGTVRIWNLQRQRSSRTYGSQGPGLGSIDVAPSNRQLITASEDGVVTLWRIRQPLARTSRRRYRRHYGETPQEEK